jgi:hypothetical protein
MNHPALLHKADELYGDLDSDWRRGDSSIYVWIGRGVFGGEFLPAEYGTHVGKLRHRRPVSL